MLGYKNLSIKQVINNRPPLHTLVHVGIRNKESFEYIHATAKDYGYDVSRDDLSRLVMNLD